MNNGVGRILLACLAVLCLTQCRSPAPERTTAGSNPVILAIFAHPDDEASVGPVLAKYAAEGARVHLAVATDGRLGVNEHAGISAGDELAAARASELNCAAGKLGLEPPVAFGLHDQLRMAEGLEPYSQQVLELRNRVRMLFEELEPDAVITWPPSGWTGHPDHRIVSAVVTEVFQSRPWTKPAALYYPGAPAGRLPESHPLAAASMDPRFLTIEVTVAAQHYETAKQAWLCHRSQYTPEQIEELHRTLIAVQQGVADFQMVAPPAKKRQSLLP